MRRLTALPEGADGKFVKGELLKVGVMGKVTGWGERNASGTREWRLGVRHVSGDAKTKAPDDTDTCRACHLPLNR